MSGIFVVGGGPAGIAAAVAAGQAGSQAVLLDDNPGLGGQIWRGAVEGQWLERLKRHKIEIATGARIVSGDARRRTLLIDKGGNAQEISYDKLILATGARELFLPFPGWTLPNVMGVGGLQALVKSGLVVEGKRIIVAGSGPLLLAVGSYLRERGAIVPLIAEQAATPALAAFALSLAAYPEKLWQAMHLQPFGTGMRYLHGCWVEAARGSGRVEGVRLRHGARVWEEPCDYLANAYGFISNTEMADLLGCTIEAGGVRVDERQQTSIDGIYCAGEAAGIGGVDTALLEGQIAGYAATGQIAEAAKLRGSLRRARSFASRMNQVFRLREELRELAQPDTIVCRCEDVTLERLRKADSWRSAKLHERCGMGPCQGRICGAALQFMLGWEPKSVRPPVFPTRLENLIQENSAR